MLYTSSLSHVQRTGSGEKLWNFEDLEEIAKFVDGIGKKFFIQILVDDIMERSARGKSLLYFENERERCKFRKGEVRPTPRVSPDEFTF